MTPNQRLKDARIKAGYSSAAEAARAMSLSVGTYAGHENGSRGILPDAAEQYARKFGVTPEWILFGRLEEQPDSDTPLRPALPRIVKMIERTLDGLTEQEQEKLAEFVKLYRGHVRGTDQ